MSEIYLPLDVRQMLGFALKYKENNTKYRSLTRKPRSHVRILIYRTWPIGTTFSREKWQVASLSCQEVIKI